MAPQVFALRPKEEDSPTACLAKDFYPKDIEIYANDIKQDNVSTILSKEGLYSALSVQNVKSDEFKCEVIQSQMLVSNTTVKSTDTDNSSDEETDNTCERTDTSSHSTEHINMLSLTVLGMRALFAKTLAFNLLLSAKIFIM